MSSSPIPLNKSLMRRFPIHPVLGLISVLFSTAAAVALIPEDSSAQGALMLPALVMSAGLVVAPGLAAFESSWAALRAEHFLVLSPIYWLLLDLIQGAYPMSRVTTNDIEWAFWSICIFVCGVWLATWVRAWRLPRIIVRSTSYITPSKTVFKLILVFFTLGFLRFAIPSGFNPVTMFDGLTSGRWAAPWARGQLGGWDSFLDHMSYFGYLLPTLTVTLAHKRGWLDKLVALSVCMSLIMTAFLAQGGGRRIVGVILGSALICWALQHKKIRVREAIGSIAGVAVLLFFMQFMLEFRNTGIQSVTASGWQMETDYLHVDDNFLRLSQIINLVPSEHSYIYEKQIFFILIRPIPRVLWPGKPVDAGFDLPMIIEQEGASLSSSAIGEFYLSAGIFAVFVGGLIYGKLAQMISTLLLSQQPSSALVYSLGTMTLIAGMRSMQDLVLMSYSILGWVVVSSIFFRLRAARGKNVFSLASQRS